VWVERARLAEQERDLRRRLLGERRDGAVHAISLGE
jgi:hypothetical protein